MDTPLCAKAARWRWKMIFMFCLMNFFFLCFRVVSQSGRPSHSCRDGWMCPVFTKRNSEFE